MPALKSPVVNPINIRFPLRRSSQGAFIANTTTLDAIASNLIILINTNFGERPCNYEFGANLRAIVFNQGPDVKQQIADRITAAVDRWMPFVNIQNILVQTSDDTLSVGYHAYRAKVTYGVGQTDLTQDVTVEIK